MVSRIEGAAKYGELLTDITARMTSLMPIARAVHDQWTSDMARGDIAVDTGRLRESLVNQGSSDHIWRTDHTELRMGSKDPASVMEGRRGKLPTPDADATGQIVSDYVMHGDK